MRLRYFFALLVGLGAAGFIGLLGAKAINTGVVALKFMTLISIPAAGMLVMAILINPNQQRRKKH